MDSGSLLVSVEKNNNFFQFWVWGSLWERRKWGCFRIFGQLCLALVANPTSHFWLKFFFETRLKSASFEPLFSLLAYL